MIGVTPQNDVGWVDAVSREPLPGPSWPLPGWTARAVSGDRRAVLLRYSASNPFLPATTDTKRFDQSRPFLEGVSTVNGAVLAWPDAHRLMIADDTGYGAPRGQTRIAIFDPLRGRVAVVRGLPVHLAGAASGRRGLVLALSPSDRGGTHLAAVSWSGAIRSIPIKRFQVDNGISGQEPSAAVALSPDGRMVMIGSSKSLVMTDLPSAHHHAFDAPGRRVTQLTWLDARYVLLATSLNLASNDAQRLTLLDTRTGGRRAIGETTTIVAIGDGHVAFTPLSGGITTVAANGARVSHHAGTTPLSMLYRQPAGPYVMAVPGAADLRAGRRVVIDLRNGALALRKTYDHAPSGAVPPTDNGA